MAYRPHAEFGQWKLKKNKSYTYYCNDSACPEQDKNNALRQDDFIPKPFDPEIWHRRLANT
jgi:hypothetical protein